MFDVALWHILPNCVVLMFVIFGIRRGTKVTGEFTNPRWVTFWRWAVNALTGGSAIARFVFDALEK